MTRVLYLAAAVFAAGAISGGAALANTCQADNFICPTTMPVDGYCECTSHGVTKDGTVVATRDRHEHVNSTTGGCGIKPSAPGCR